MSNQAAPYVARNPGDLLSASDWNEMQLAIKADIEASKAAVKEEIREEGVDKAANSEKFDNKGPGEWVAQLDERYAPKVHDHEEVAGYRRFIKRFSKAGEDDMALLEHGLGRYPLVDLYLLTEVVGIALDKEKEKDKKRWEELLSENPALQGCKLFVYYGHREAEKYALMASINRNKVRIGIPLERFLAELAVEYEDDDTLEDVLNDMLDAFMEDPNDEIGHCRSSWIEKSIDERRTVHELKVADEWPDIRVALAPLQLRGEMAHQEAEISLSAANNTKSLKVRAGLKVSVFHANYETTVVFVEKLQKGNFSPSSFGNREIKVEQVSKALPPLDLMILLRS